MTNQNTIKKEMGMFLMSKIIRPTHMPNLQLFVLKTDYAPFEYISIHYRVIQDANKTSGQGIINLPMQILIENYEYLEKDIVTGKKEWKSFRKLCGLTNYINYLGSNNEKNARSR